MRDAGGRAGNLDRAAHTAFESTDGLPPAQRWDHWTDVALGAVDGAPIVDRTDFAARRTVARTALGTLIRTASEPLAIERSARRISRDGLDDVCLVLMPEGRGRIDAGVRGEDALGGNDMVLFDVGRPYAAAGLTAYKELRLYVPRRLFAARVGRIEALAGLRIPGEGALADLFVAHLAALSRAMPGLSPDEAEAGMDGVLHLLAGLVRLRTAAEAADAEGRLSRGGLLALADRRIQASLQDPALDAAVLARALGVSRSRLYEAFAGRGGVSAAIRDARLDRVRDGLASPAGVGRPIEELAYACGFTDYPSFSRAFKRRFGRSPRAARGR